MILLKLPYFSRILQVINLQDFLLRKCLILAILAAMKRVFRGIARLFFVLDGVFAPPGRPSALPAVQVVRNRVFDSFLWGNWLFLMFERCCNYKHKNEICILDDAV